MNKFYLFIIIAALAVGICTPLAAANWDVRSDSWVATDALGRTLPSYVECGPPRANRTVGIFYLLWLGIYGGGGPYDITKILAANPTDPQWGPYGVFHHWGEAELGYYRSDDEFVMRKHCQMLVDAGIDVLMLDATNGDPYTAHYMKLCQVFQQIRNEGGITPQICFFVNWEDNSLVQVLYNDFYSKNLYPDLWFRWLGKPLILTKPDGLNPTLQSFFTFRKTWAWSDGIDNWSWIDYYPQLYHYHISGVPEEISVSIAQQYPPHSGAMSDGTGHGRHYHDGVEPPSSEWTGHGYNFAEQWQRALEVDPPFVFVDGWNEWVAQRLTDENGNTKFVDQYTQEYSRDIEPMKGGHTDNYYYQLVNYVRQYKGVRAPENPSAAKTIAIDGNFSDWDSVAPTYKDYPNDTMQRNTVGWDGLLNYVNTTGRNDFTLLKVAQDNNYVYFCVETKDATTPYTDPNWMLLFIDSDCNSSTGWNGYDYLVNSPVVDANKTTLKKTTSGWNWTTVRNDITYKVLGTKMELRIPRADIGQDRGPNVELDFHWADNIQKTDDIIEFSVSGDSAPNRRFNYRYNTLPEPVSGFIATPGNGKITLSWRNPADSDFARLVIRYSTTGYPTSPTDGTLLAEKTNIPSSFDSYAHTGLTAGTEYFYSIFTYDRFGSCSSVANAKTNVLRVATILNSNFTIPSSGWIFTRWGFDLSPANWGTIGWDGTVGYPSGAGIRCSGNGSIDDDDRFSREGGEMKRIISTSYYENINITYDLRVSTLGNNRSGVGTGTADVYSNDIQDQLIVYYSTTGTNGPWIEAEWLGRSTLLNYLTYGNRLIDLSGISGISDNADFALKFLWQFNTASANGDIGDLDNIKVTGSILGKNGNCGSVRSLVNGTTVSFADKVLYYKSGSVGYIEDSNRSSGIRIEGSLSSASVDNALSVIGTMQTKSSGERYISVSSLLRGVSASVYPLAMNQQGLKRALADGLCVRVWGRIKPGSVTTNSYILVDGSDDDGIKVITTSTPSVTANTYVALTGAAGMENGARVIYQSQVNTYPEQ